MASSRKRPKLDKSDRGGREDAEEDDGYSALERPTVIEQLRAILDQYPDDGQILKELIQNAEDAGASVVRLVYDGRDYSAPRTGKRKKDETLPPHVKPLQGPALCAYNDALFTPQDWAGIKMLQKSVKAKDILKVGRFGLGFKSVFHITDFICIVSGKRILFMNPLLPENQMCYSSRLTKLSGDAKEACLQTMGGLFGFGEDAFQRGSFQGTLFWLPLRREGSQLSDTLYDAERVAQLFQSFRTEAPTILLFLRKVESVELYLRRAVLDDYPPPGTAEPAKVFAVSLEDDCRDRVREERQRFTDEVLALEGGLPPDPLIGFTGLGVQIWTKDQGGHAHVSTDRWLVATCYSGSDVSDEFQQLCGDDNLSYSPLVGLAAPLSDHPDFQGQISCFLPLPLQSTSPTGLPAHVNGFFALSANRRHVKWPSADQADQQLHDRALLWNQGLVSQVLPRLYAALLEKLTSEDDVRTMEALVPRDADVQPEWRDLLPQLYDRLKTVACARSLLDGGRWVLPGEAVLATQGLAESVLQVYLHLECHVVRAPEHVIAALRHAGCTTETSPSHLSGLLRERGVPEACDANGRLALLEFLLSSQDLHLVAGLPLLPTADNDFCQFQPMHPDPTSSKARRVASLSTSLMTSPLTWSTSCRAWKRAC